MTDQRDDQFLFARYRSTLYPFKDWAREDGFTAEIKESHREVAHKSYHYRLTISGFDGSPLHEEKLNELTKLTLQGSLGTKFKWDHGNTAYAQEEATKNASKGKRENNKQKVCF
jgi:hypothetical protein